MAFRKLLMRKGYLNPHGFYPPDPKLSRFAGVREAAAEREPAGEVLSEAEGSRS
jgi:hypothetical protein